MWLETTFLPISIRRESRCSLTGSLGSGSLKDLATTVTQVAGPSVGQRLLSALATQAAHKAAHDMVALLHQSEEVSGARESEGKTEITSSHK